MQPDDGKFHHIFTLFFNPSLMSYGSWLVVMLHLSWIDGLLHRLSHSYWHEGISFRIRINWIPATCQLHFGCISKKSLLVSVFVKVNRNIYKYWGNKALVLSWFICEKLKWGGYGSSYGADKKEKFPLVGGFDQLLGGLFSLYSDTGGWQVHIRSAFLKRYSQVRWSCLSLIGTTMVIMMATLLFFDHYSWWGLVIILTKDTIVAKGGGWKE